MATCSRCGVVEDLDGDGTGLPAGWSSAASRRGVTFLCSSCTRLHVRDIEAKLDEDWWG